MPARFAAVTVALLSLLGPALALATEGSARDGAFSLELIDETGDRLPTYQSGARTYVLGAAGRRYALRLRNGSSGRVEFVAAVDGRDVLDGRPSAFAKRGYLVEAHGEVVIDGFRLDTESVAAFRFSSVSHSYAARMGDARDVGVIGVAVFTERVPLYLPPPEAQLPGIRGDDGDEDRSGEPAPPASLPLPASAGAAKGSHAHGGADRNAERPGLGTEFGEQRPSQVFETPFDRASERPAALLSLRYDDRSGLRALGLDLDRSWHRGDLGRRETAQPFRRDPTYAQPPSGWDDR